MGRARAKGSTESSRMIVVLSGASGSGKTTLARKLVEMVPGLEKSISFTTRPPRPDETPGMAYHFVDASSFRAMRERGAFVEWAEVHGNLYGTSADQIESRLAAGMDVVCDIDVQGGAAIRRIFRDRSVLIFVLPPSWGELERRLRARGTESEETIAQRLKRGREEHHKALRYDYLVLNQDFSAAASAIHEIVQAERSRTRRVLAHLSPDLVDGPARRRRR